MGDIVVSVAEFKAHLSRLLAESRAFGKTIVILNRKKPVATVLPYDDRGYSGKDTHGGLASLAGAWPEWEEIRSGVEEIYNSRNEEGFREVSF